MTRKEIIAELQNRGYKAVEQSTIKNGVKCEGIRIDNGTDVAPLVYTADIIAHADEQGLDVSGVVDNLVCKVINAELPDLDAKAITEAEFIKAHVRIGLQRTSEQELVKRPYLDGIEQYLFVKINDEMSYKLAPQMIAGLDDIWESALANTFAETRIRSMLEVLCEMMHIAPEDYPFDDSPIYVVTNTSGKHGASAILDKQALKALADSLGVSKFALLPSSVHECLVIPFDDSMSEDELSDMVSNVNAQVVDPTEQLADRAYIITL